MPSLGLGASISKTAGLTSSVTPLPLPTVYNIEVFCCGGGGGGGANVGGGGSGGQAIRSYFHGVEIGESFSVVV